jgi:hypothetical protein
LLHKWYTYSFILLKCNSSFSSRSGSLTDRAGLLTTWARMLAQLIKKFKWVNPYQAKLITKRVSRWAMSISSPYWLGNHPQLKSHVGHIWFRVQLLPSLPTFTNLIKHRWKPKVYKGLYSRDIVFQVKETVKRVNDTIQRL